MLKAATTLALLLIVTGSARAGEGSDLIVGSLRDRRGVPISGATVVAVDAHGTPVGRDRSDGSGTFVVAPERLAVALEIRCTYCRRTHVGLSGGNQNVALVIDRYAALQSSVPDAGDLAALPYGAPVDALGLIPFTLPSRSSISDRGLGGGRGLIVDDGAPYVDVTGGTSALPDFPERYVRSIDFGGAENAYRYGAFAGGGVFALDQLDADHSSLSLDSGGASSGALEPSLGNVDPAAGVSSDGSTLARRADVDYSGPFAGGSLRSGFGTGSNTAPARIGDDARDFSTARVAYATASRRYRTFADFSASDAASSNAVALTDYRSGYLNADFRIEHPGPVTVSAGASTERITGSYATAFPLSYAYAARANVANAYVEAQTGNERASLDAGLGITDIAAAETLARASPSGTHVALLPSLTGRIALGGGTYARAGFSESARLPTLLETDSGYPYLLRDVPFERSELTEGALGFDDGNRVRGEAIAYREFTHDFNERRLDGIGLSIVWQIAPLVSVRAWSLRASPQALSPSPVGELDASRQVLWSTYANANGMRFDAIVHRDAGLAMRPALAFDADAFVPLMAHLAIDVGTAERAATQRRYYVGLRASR